MEHSFNEANFKSEVLESKTPVLVDFYADWCGPCKMMGPVVSQVAEKYDGKLKVGKINVDDNPNLAQEYGVMSIPNFKIFKDGKEVLNIVGAVGKPALEQQIESVL